MPSRVRVTFEPAGSMALVESGTSVAEAALAAGVLVPRPCAGRGICGQCAVRVVDGHLAEADDVERAGLRSAPDDVRLACRARVIADVVVRPLAVASANRAAAEGSGRCLVGVDLGTTTVNAAAVDAHGDRELWRGQTPNLQQSFGADILHRLSAAADHGGELEELAAQSIRGLIDAMGPGMEVDRVVVAANTAMAALLSGASVDRLGVHPFEVPVIPRRLEPSRLAARLLGGVPIELMPPIAGFVGGDVASGLLASGLLDRRGRHLYVDIGTNAEVAVIDDGRLWVGSAAAGPAFEGAGISSAGPPVPGAIASTSMRDGRLELRTIGDEAPVWLTGAGVVSLIATLRRSEVLAEDGRLAEGALVELDDAGVARVVVDRSAGIHLTQLDVRTVQLAKGAVQTAIHLVLRQAGLIAEELDDVHIAGAFGAAIDTADLVELGVLPEVVGAATRSIGNASLDGAIAAVKDPGLIDLIAEQVSGAERVDLASDPDFTQTLLASLSFARS